MKRTVVLALRPSPDQNNKLQALRTAFVAACNAVSVTALNQRTTNRVQLHHLTYYAIRARFPHLGSQMVCNAMALVARSLKAHRAKGRPWPLIRFHDRGSVHLDARTYRLKGDSVSLFTLEGREHMGLRIGAFQRRYLDRGIVKEAELVERRGRWYLNVVLDVRNPSRAGGAAVLGVDLGENVAAATSGGCIYGGGTLREKRDRFLAFRKRLQGNGSQSARQLLKRVSGRESRHARHVNHEISASIAREALQGGWGTIAMENLTNIRTRIKARKRMRTRLHRWAWRQLQQFVQYKAEAAGIAVVYVDPAYTSQTCSQCERIGQRRRHRFSCKECGIFAHSDRNAARNIAKIGARALVPTGDVMRPHVAA